MPLLLVVVMIALALASVFCFIARQWLPALAASAGAAFDHQLNLTLAVFGAAFLMVQVALAALIWKARPPAANRRDRYSGSSPALEISALVLTSAVFLTLGIKGGALSVTQQRPGEPHALQVEVTAVQFQWYYRYAGPDGRFGITKPELVDASLGNPLGLDASDPDAKDDIVSAQLVVPMDRSLELTLKSQDVVHSFFVPTMRLQMNAVPGLITHAAFTPTQAGDFEVVCNQLCGLGHYRMRSALNVVSNEQFEKWLASRSRR